jgi:competence protein ComEA
MIKGTERELKSWQLVLFGLLCALLAAGGITLINKPGRGAPIELPDAPEQDKITVDVSGAVSNPGVYQLPFGSRVEDAIKAAGGLLPESYTESLNLAAVLIDGTKVLVPYQQPTALPPEPGDVQPDKTPTPEVVYPININSAPLETLIALPGIGEVKAQAIIDYRNQHGPFTSPEQIMKVSGIGPGTYESIKDLITVY